MANGFYAAVGLIGGTTGMLDEIDGALLTDGDGALVITATNVYLYILDDDSAAGESSPLVISPDDNAGTKRWILVPLSHAARFYPRTLNQSLEPAAGTGATQCAAGEAVIWTDTDDAKCYLCYNHSGTVKTVELT